MMKVQNKLQEDLSEKAKGVFTSLKLRYEDLFKQHNLRKGINQTINAHYNGLEVEDSTEPKDDFDYIHNEVKPVVDMNVSTISKGLMPNDRLEFAFELETAEDGPASKQAHALVHHYLNVENKPSMYMVEALQCAQLYGSGFLHVAVVEEEDSRVLIYSGSESDHQAFKAKAIQSGLTVKRLSSEKQTVDQEMESIAADENVYTCRYRASKIRKKVKIYSMDDDYIIADNYTPDIQDQQAFGYYDIVTVAQLIKDHGVDKRKAIKASSLSDLSVLQAKVSPEAGAALGETTGDGENNPMARKVARNYTWYIDKDEGLLEVCWSGSLIIYMKPVDFIPVVSITPTPWNNNLYGISDARHAVPAQEWMTATSRAALSYAFEATASQRFANTKADIDLDAFMEGESLVMVEGAKPTIDFGDIPKSLGDMSGIQWSYEAVNNNKRDKTGAMQGSDTVNHEIMRHGNSGAKLQLAMTPTNLTAERKIRNCATGCRNLVYIMWKTLVQLGDDISVTEVCGRISSKLAGVPTDQFLDYIAINQEYNWYERKASNISLAIGMSSEENMIAQSQMVLEMQSRFVQEVMAMVQTGIVSFETPDLIEARRNVYINILEGIFNRSDADKIIPTMEMIAKIAQEAQAKAQPSPEQEALQALALKEKEAGIMKDMADAGYKDAQTAHQQVETVLTEMFGPQIAKGEFSKANLNV